MKSVFLKNYIYLKNSEDIPQILFIKVLTDKEAIC